ncbi:hypothetical protein LTR37_012615 [Vermiconidia calcicola]|uniref:Uncharacterized protein n=1 Tax=Vermiconidia calcicola TaxID=1690605 RepID=A0ACC3MYL1_9PEZI|nr:hypothetical protein LTR37_012615 [Vermiconidia calcicola]
MPPKQQEIERLERLEREQQRPLMELPDSPIFHPARPMKILVSPGTGAGWISWAPKGPKATDAFLIWMLTYNPMIRALEAREHKGNVTAGLHEEYTDCADRGVIADKLEEHLKNFHREAHAKFDIERIVCARVGDLVVHEVDGPFEVHENDGAERIMDLRNRRVIHM